MPNLFIPRERLHQWVEEVAADPERHKQPITYLVKNQRRISKYVATNARSLTVGRRGTALFFQGLISRIYDLSGGLIKTATTDHIKTSERAIGAVLEQIMPPDDGFAYRVRQIEWRAQPHIIDECLHSLFDNDDLDRGDVAKLFLIQWVVIETLDVVWTPPANFDGEALYEYVPIASIKDAE